MMKFLWKSVHGVSAIRTVGEWISVILLMAFLFFLIFAMAAGFGRPPDVDVSTPEPNPQIEAIIQQQEDLSHRMEALEEDMQEILQQLNRILGVEEVSMTAYCSCSHCTYPYNDGITATGAPAIAGDGSRDNPHLVAVDPRVIPLGSQLYVEGLGYALAVDVGGAIKGHRIDLLMPSHQMALVFGRQNARVLWYAAA